MSRAVKRYRLTNLDLKKPHTEDPKSYAALLGMPNIKGYSKVEGTFYLKRIELVIGTIKDPVYAPFGLSVYCEKGKAPGTGRPNLDVELNDEQLLICTNIDNYSHDIVATNRAFWVENGDEKPLNFVAAVKREKKKTGKQIIDYPPRLRLKVTDKPNLVDGMKPEEIRKAESYVVKVWHRKLDGSEVPGVPKDLEQKNLFLSIISSGPSLYMQKSGQEFGPTYNISMVWIIQQPVKTERADEGDDEKMSLPPPPPKKPTREEGEDGTQLDKKNETGEERGGENDEKMPPRPSLPPPPPPKKRTREEGDDGTQLDKKNKTGEESDEGDEADGDESTMADEGLEEDEVIGGNSTPAVTGN